MAPLPRDCVGCDSGLSDGGRVIIYIIAGVAGLFCLSSIYYYAKESRYEQAEQHAFSWKRIILSALKFATFIGFFTWLYHQYKLNKTRSQFLERGSSFQDKPVSGVHLINDPRRPLTAVIRLEKRPETPDFDFVPKVDRAERGRAQTRARNEPPQLLFRKRLCDGGRDGRDVIETPKNAAIADSASAISPTTVVPPLVDCEPSVPSTPRRQKRLAAHSESQAALCDRDDSSETRHSGDSSILGDMLYDTRTDNGYGDAQRLAEKLDQVTKTPRQPNGDGPLYLFPGAPPPAIGMYVMTTDVRHSV